MKWRQYPVKISRPFFPLSVFYYHHPIDILQIISNAFKPPPPLHPPPPEDVGAKSQFSSKKKKKRESMETILLWRYFSLGIADIYFFLLLIQLEIEMFQVSLNVASYGRNVSTWSGNICDLSKSIQLESWQKKNFNWKGTKFSSAHRGNFCWLIHKTRTGRSIFSSSSRLTWRLMVEPSRNAAGILLKTETKLWNQLLRFVLTFNWRGSPFIDAENQRINKQIRPIYPKRFQFNPSSLLFSSNKQLGETFGVDDDELSRSTTLRWEKLPELWSMVQLQLAPSWSDNLLRTSSSNCSSKIHSHSLTCRIYYRKWVDEYESLNGLFFVL